MVNSDLAQTVQTGSKQRSTKSDALHKEYTLTCRMGSTDTIHFIAQHTDKPADRTATYLRIVAALKPNKTEPKRICFTVGGDRIDYKGNVSTLTADLMTV